MDMYAQHCEAIRQRYSAVLGTNALSPNTLQQHKILPNGHKDTHKEPAGQLHMCGAGDSGQLGLGEDVLELLSPKWLSLPGRVHVTSVACGGMHTLALTERGTVFSWGVNDEGALGRSASKYSEGSESTPKQVHFPKHLQITQISAGDSHSLALSSVCPMPPLLHLFSSYCYIRKARPLQQLVGPMACC